MGARSIASGRTTMDEHHETDLLTEESQSKLSTSSETEGVADVDNLLTRAGGFGLFQWTYLAIICLSYGTDGMIIVSSNLTGRNVHPNCHQREKVCHCPIPVDWSDVDKSESYIGEWELICEKKPLVPLLNSLLFLGWIPGAIVFGYLADRHGRRPAVILCSWLNTAIIIARSIPLLSPTYAIYATLVFFQGFAIGGRATTIYLLMSEFTVQHFASKMTAILFSTWCILSASLGPLALLVDSHAKGGPESKVLGILPAWRSLLLMIAILEVVSAALVLHLHETPKWIAEKSASAPSVLEKLMKNIAKRNGKNDSDFSDLLQPQSDDFQNTESTLEDPPLLPSESLVHTKDPNPTARSYDTENGILKKLLGPYSELLTWKPVSGYPLIFISLAMVMAWFATSFVFYGLFLNIGDMGASIYLSQALASLAQLPASALSSIPIDEFGRKPTLAGGLATGSISCFIVAKVSATIIPKLVSLVAIAGVTFSFTAIYVYATEVFPLPLVGVGLGVCQSAARISGVVAPFVSLLPRFAHFIVFGVVAGGSALGIFFGVPETKVFKQPHVATRYWQRIETS